MEHSELVMKYVEDRQADTAMPITANTARNYRNYLHHLETQAGIPIHAFTAETAEHLLDAEYPSVKMASQMLAAGRRFFDWALEHGCELAVTENPFTGKRVKREKPVKVLDSSPLIEEFLTAKAHGIQFSGEPAAETTIRTYRRQLRRLEAYADKPLEEIMPEDAEMAIAQSIEDNQSSAYRNLMLSAGRGFYDWALRNGKPVKTTVNPFIGIKMNTRGKRKHPKGITQAQFDRLLKMVEVIDQENVDNALTSGPKAANMPWVNDEARLPKKVLPLKLMYYGGLRISEATSLQQDNVLADGVVINGKGDKERFVTLPKWLMQELAEYIVEYSEDDTYVFTPMRTSRMKDGHPLHASRVHEVFHAAAKRAGLPDWVTPHSLRHAFAKRALDRTKRLDIVQDLLGHENIETTRIYAKNDREDIREAAKNIWGD